LGVVESDGTDEYVGFECGGCGESSVGGEGLIGALFFAVEIGGGGAKFSVRVVFSEGSLELIVAPIPFGNFVSLGGPDACPAVFFAFFVEGFGEFDPRRGVGEGGTLAEIVLIILLDNKRFLVIPFARRALLFSKNIESF